MAKKTSPNGTLETLARAAGANVQVFWIMPGPKDTQIAWIECLLIEKTIVLVETYKEVGWDAFVQARADSNRVDDTIAYIFSVCGVPLTEKA